MAGREVLDDDRMVAENVRAAREAAGLTCRQMGEALGISYQQIQKYEKAKTRMTVGLLLAIARTLNVSAASLLDDAANDAPKAKTKRRAA